MDRILTRAFELQSIASFLVAHVEDAHNLQYWDRIMTPTKVPTSEPRPLSLPETLTVAVAHTNRYRERVAESEGHTDIYKVTAALPNGVEGHKVGG